MKNITETYLKFKDWWNKQKERKEFTVSGISQELRICPESIKKYLIDAEKKGCAEIKKELVRNRIMKIIKIGNVD